jgi:REP element-mobilizing transposase RayT
MIRAYHIIFCAYGFWLPNDPRGSWSDLVKKWELRRFGEATKVNMRRSQADQPHDHKKRQKAQQALTFPAVHFNGRQARAIARGFARARQETGMMIYACSILPEHVHLVVERGTETAERMVKRFKALATHQLRMEGLHPLAGYTDHRGRTPSPWSQRQWQVFLDSQHAIHRAVEYVENNPLKEGKPAQRWSFVDRPW